MKSLPGYPNAPAVVLYREEMESDEDGEIHHYDRIKVLTEAGKKYATVQLDYVQGDDAKRISDIAARVIHPDGAIVPFTGKPYVKTLVNQGPLNIQEVVFSLPDVEVGSILEYSYTTNYRGYLEPPTWNLQDELYVKLEQFFWKPVLEQFQFGARTASWVSTLPPGAQIERKFTGHSGVFVQAKTWNRDSIGVVVSDVPPLPELDHMPPLDSVRYRVLFNYVFDKDPKDFWDTQGGYWSKGVEAFTRPTDQLTQTAAAVTDGASRQEDKLRKLYAFVMSMENTGDTRVRDRRENKLEGRAKIKSVDDVLSLKRGNPYALTALFVALARAAGMRAYAMYVPNREFELFNERWLSFRQFDALVAIVSVDGAEHFFDPGTRYCEFGHLAWQHTLVGGLRQTATGTAIVVTPGDGPQANYTGRTGFLRVQSDGTASGKLVFSLTGAPALRLRQIALRGDESELRQRLKDDLEGSLPNTLQAEVADVGNLTDYDKPLKLNLNVHGTLGTLAGKRRVFPADLFTSREAALFVQPDRQIPVYLDYPQTVEDAFRLNLPSGSVLESAPKDAKLTANHLTYEQSVTASGASFTTRRLLVSGRVYVPVEEYGALHDFYSQCEVKDREILVVKTVSDGQTSPSN